jgi:hypothetical protein
MKILGDGIKVRRENEHEHIDKTDQSSKNVKKWKLNITQPAELEKWKDEGSNIIIVMIWSSKQATEQFVSRI